jgi:UrcA family protein
MLQVVTSGTAGGLRAPPIVRSVFSSHEMGQEKPMNSRTVKMAAAAMMLGIAAVAGAGNLFDSEVKVQTARVSFADLDLHKPEGLATLHWRLRQAVSQACDQGDSGLSASRYAAKCREQAIEAAMPRLPAAVRAYHAQWRANGGRWFDRTELASVQFASR